MDEDGAQEQPVRRRGCMGCLSLVVLWVLVATCSITIAVLAGRGEIVQQRGELGERRVWLVTENENRGLGFSSARVVSGSEESRVACVRTRVGFLLWRSAGRGQGTSYCECFEESGGQWQVTEEVCRE